MSDWFDVTPIKEQDRMLINANAIMSVEYNDEIDLTTINFIRAAYPSVCVRGDVMKDIRRLLSSHDNYVTRIGE